MKHLLIASLLVACSSSPPPAPATPAQPMKHDHAKHEHGKHDHDAHRNHEHHGSAHHRFEKAEDWVPMFDDPERDTWQKPDEVVAALDLKAGMAVADIGAGTGYFEGRLSKAVGPSGKVLAVDVEPDMVRYLGERAKRENMGNVTAHLAAGDDPKLAAGSLDRILIVDTWHHVPERPAYAKKLAQAVKPGGAVLIVDFTLDAKRGPPPAMRLAPDAIRADLESAGFRVSLVSESLPDQYILRAER